METILTPELKAEIESQISSTPVVLYMKGTPSQPMCGFSARAVGVLNNLGVSFTGINILERDDLRAGLKEFGDWPTFPQLYVNGSLIGGADIMVEMYNSGELADLLGSN